MRCVPRLSAAAFMRVSLASASNFGVLRTTYRQVNRELSQLAHGGRRRLVAIHRPILYPAVLI